MIHLIPGQGFTRRVGDDEAAAVFRVLHVRRSLNRLIAIPMEEQRSSGRLYYRGYRAFDLAEIEAALSRPTGDWRTVELPRSPRLMLSDDEIRQQGGERSLELRAERWALIRPLVDDHEQAELLFDKEWLVRLTRERACELQRDPSRQTAQRARICQMLYRYWAGGSEINALLPAFDRCGAPGRPKTVRGKKLGRPNAAVAAGVTEDRGHILTEGDKEVIEHAWTHFLIRGRTVGSAYRRMCREFYSDEQFCGGQRTTTLWPQNRRPTQSQFRHWGKKLTGESASRRLAKRGDYRYRQRALPGSANDGVIAVGQVGGIDSTPADVELVSSVSRLLRIGVAHREVLVDELYGYFPGFYQGLTPPCAETVRLAVLHAMLDKTQWLRDLGIEDECPPEDWLPIQFQTLKSDNTDARSEGVYEGLLDSGGILGIQHIATYSSDRNALVETTHRRMHRMGDHKMSGTNWGRRTERGEQRAEVRANRTLIETIRDTARTVHAENTKELPDVVLSERMRRDGVRPTRLEMTRWAMEQGKIAMVPMPREEAIARLMPVYEGVFTESGVRLLRPDTGRKKTIIRALRYVSRDQRLLNLMERARRDGHFDGQFRVDPFNLRRIWFLDIESGGLIELGLVSDDEDLVAEFTLPDVVEREHQDGIDRLVIRERADQTVSRLEEQLEAGNREAAERYREEAEARNRPLSKREISANKKKNRQQERQRCIQGLPIQLRAEDLPPTDDEPDKTGTESGEVVDRNRPLPRQGGEN